jgi:hypothetical protein
MLSRILLTATALFASTVSFAQYNLKASEHRFVISSIKAEKQGGPSNPNSFNIRLKGTIKIGNNACEGSRYDAVLVSIHQDGGLHILPHVELLPQARTIICPAHIDFNYQGVPFNQGFIVSNSAPATVYNVGRLDAHQSMLSLMAKSARDNDPCSRSRICAAVVDPASCSDSSGRIFEGSNSCLALGEAQQFACENRLPFREADFHCVKEFDRQD